ncbi:hypothetical protein Tco_0330471 [Tanacetum coccineum]
MVPRTVLTRSGPISVNAARPVNTVQSRTSVNNAGPIRNGTRVNTTRPKAVISLLGETREMLLRPQHVGFGDQSTKF